MVYWNKIQRQNPIDKSLAWYPTIKVHSTLNISDVVAGIVEKCTLTKVDVQAVLIALEDVIIEQLKNGNSVRFGTLGSFRPTIKSRVWDEKMKRYTSGGCPVATTVLDDQGKVDLQGVTVDNIAGISVSFTKSAEMRARLSRSQLKFKQIEGERSYPVKP